jgi:hypothetical protein
MTKELSNQDLRVPSFCPVCGGLMKGRSTFTFYDFGCCVDCYVWFLEDRPQKKLMWKEGWRPSEEELKKYKEFMKD